jgi:arsenate reductase (glutaredoxin)
MYPQRRFSLLTHNFRAFEMDKITIYHNPRCSKSRQALQLLRERGIDPIIVEYLKHPLDAAQIKRLLKMLQAAPRELMRKKESEYKDLNLADTKLSQDSLINALAEHPILMERPIVVIGSKAVLGRPPEKVLEIL